MSLLNFNGRVAIVTGSGQGMGREHALSLAKREARVVVNDISTTSFSTA
jgi:NAD(P)-dependent dehydrogenase (short-subunit alcohol dehydrogenase family)